MAQYKIVTCNIRGAFGVDGENEFALRKEAVVKHLTELLPDVIGFQELNHEMRMELIALMPGYAFLGGGREKNRLGESSAIAYRQNRLIPERVLSEILSPTPHIPGTTYGEDQSKCPRIFSSCDFMPIDSDTPIRVMNIHTDHLGKSARLLECRQLLNSYTEQQALRPMPTAITGDFNATPDAPEIKLISESGCFTDVTSGIDGSFHGFGKFISSPVKIDYVFVSEEFKPVSVKSYRYTNDGRYLSDHDIIEAILEI